MKREIGWIKKLIAEECKESPEFKAAYEGESAFLALVRARSSADLSQRDDASVTEYIQE